MLYIELFEDQRSKYEYMQKMDIQRICSSFDLLGPPVFGLVNFFYHNHGLTALPSFYTFWIINFICWSINLGITNGCGNWACTHNLGITVRVLIDCSMTSPSWFVTLYIFVWMANEQMYFKNGKDLTWFSRK